MSEKLCTLRTKGGGGGRYTETSLWTNSAPTSAFGAQTISLSSSISNYKYIKVKFKFETTSTADAQNGSFIVSVEDFKKATYNAYSNILTYIIGSANVSYHFARYFEYVSDTSVYFSVAYTVNNANSNNSRSIPLEILGLNELDHGTKITSNVEVFPLATVTGGTQPTYTTKGRAVAIWQMWGRTDNVGFGIRTNVNPTTGAINNNEIYMSQSGGMSWNIQSGASFTVTDTTITTTAISNNNRVVALAYTY